MNRLLTLVKVVLVLFFINASVASATTIYQTSSSDTLGTFRTNVNSSLVNLDAQLLSTTSDGVLNQLPIWTGAGSLGSIATSALGLLTTNVAEGSNLYFTNAHAQTFLDSVFKGYFFSTTSSDYWLTTKSTSDLAEGSNKYYTTARGLADFITNLAATSSVKSITTLPSLSLPYTQLTGTPSLLGTTTPWTTLDLAQVASNGTVKSIATSSLKLTVSSFASANISQWTNNAGYLATYDAFTHPASGVSATSSALLIQNATSTFTGGLTIGTATTTSATSTNFFATTASSTKIFGGGLPGAGCTGSNFLQWSSGLFACGTPSGGGSIFGQALDIDSAGYIAATSSATVKAFSAGGSGSKFGYAIDDVFVGYSSTTNRSTIWGAGAGGSATTSNNASLDITAVGYQALNAFSGTSLAGNTAVGAFALENNTSGIANTAVGNGALESNITGTNNVAVGRTASTNNGSATGTVAIGACSGGCSASPFAAQGYTVVGDLAGTNFATGADYNSLFGYQAGTNITSGEKNIYLGAFTTDTNANITTGSNNIVIGNDVKVPSATQSNQLNIGNAIFGTGLSGTGTTIAGSIGVSTSSPLKTFTTGGDVYIGASSAGGTLGNLYLPALSSQSCLGTDSAGKFQAGTCGSSYTTSFPLSITGSALSWIGVATSSNLTSGRVHYSTGVNTFADAATSSIASGTGITVTNGSSAYVIGSQPTITNTGVISGSCTWPLTCSGTNPLAFTWSGLATSTALASNQVLVGTAVNTFGSFSGFTYSNTSSLLTITNASTTALTANSYFGAGGATFTIDSSGKVQAKDTNNGWTGIMSPTRSLVLQTGTTTAWSGTTSAPYIPESVAPFAGTIKQVRCHLDQSFLGVEIDINDTAVAPKYFVASTTVGTIVLTGTNTFNAGDRISAKFGTTTTATTLSGDCTVDVIQTS